MIDSVLCWNSTIGFERDNGVNMYCFVVVSVLSIIYWLLFCRTVSRKDFSDRGRFLCQGCFVALGNKQRTEWGQYWSFWRRWDVVQRYFQCSTTPHLTSRCLANVSMRRVSLPLLSWQQHRWMCNLRKKSILFIIAPFKLLWKVILFTVIVELSWNVIGLSPSAIEWHCPCAALPPGWVTASSVKVFMWISGCFISYINLAE